MADTVTVDYVYTGTRRVIVKMTNVSDATGESAVIKVNLSDLIGPDGTAPTRSVAEWVSGNVQGFTSVKLAWDHTANDTLAVLGTGFNYLDWPDSGGFTDPASTGGTGDVVLTTVGASATATYDITISLRLKD